MSGPGAGLASAGFGVMLHLFIMRLNQADAVQQRGVNRVRRFACKISEIVKAPQPVTFLFQATTATAIGGRIKKSVLRTILDSDIIQYKQSRVR